MVVVDSIVRLIPGVINPNSLTNETSWLKKAKTKIIKHKRKHPVYTRPEIYKGWKVPEILLSGNHKKISDWKKDRSK